MNLNGQIAIGTSKSKATIRNFTVSAAGGESLDKGLDMAPREPYTGDDPKFIETIERDIIEHNVGVSWDDIASLTDAKR